MIIDLLWSIRGSPSFESMFLGGTLIFGSIKNLPMDEGGRGANPKSTAMELDWCESEPSIASYIV